MTKLYLPALLWLLFITGLSVTPNVQFPEFDLFSVDKLGHLAAYGVLVVLLLYGFEKQKGRRAGWKEILAMVVFATLYGTLMEFVQGAFVPGRIFGYDDMIANAVGAAAVWAWETWKPRPA